jgi:hypothetical protein
LATAARRAGQHRAPEHLGGNLGHGGRRRRGRSALRADARPPGLAIGMSASTLRQQREIQPAQALVLRLAGQLLHRRAVLVRHRTLGAAAALLA